jgi:hypothetical protein
MTLKFKLCEPFGGLRTETADQLEQIADEHAIEFADWLDSDEATTLILDLQMVGDLPKTPKTKELLQIFKKEKGL